MPYLSLEPPKKDDDAIPIALTQGGYYDKELLYLYEKGGEECKDTKARGGMNKKTEIKLPPDCAFLLLPSPKKDKREIFYIAGASGSGKSYQVRGLAERYKKLFPERDIYLITKLPEDETLDTMKTGKPKRVKIETLLDNPIEDIGIFKDSMVIFDDADTIEGALGKAVQLLIDDIASMGRHHNITMCVATHYLTNYKKTRLLLNEASHFIVYPQATSYHALKHLLSNHIGMESDDVKKLKTLGRWVMIKKGYPQLLVSEHLAKILHCEEE
jgi:hypothetical protein